MAISKEEKHWNEIEWKMSEVWKNGKTPIVNRQLNFLGDLCRWVINNKPDKKQMYKELRRIEREEQKAFNQLRKKLNKDAKKFDTLSHIDVLNKGLHVMDSTAASLCMDNNIPILVFNLNDPDNIVRAMQGETIGTIVK